MAEMKASYLPSSSYFSAAGRLRMVLLFVITCIIAQLPLPGHALARSANGDPEGAAGDITLEAVWVTALDGTPRTALSLGSQVRYNASIYNQTASVQTVGSTWAVEGPCGIITNDAIVLESPPGSVDWMYFATLGWDLCEGSYTLTVTLSFEGESSQVSAGFEIIDHRVYLPVTRK